MDKAIAELDFSKVDDMTEEEEERFMEAFTEALANNPFDEAKRHLDAGRAVHTYDERYPDALIKHHPDGKRQLVTFDNENTEIVLRDLPDE